MGSLRDWIEAFVARHFDFFQRHGFHVVPNRFDQPVPDTSRLPHRLWVGPSKLPGIDMRHEAQLALLEEMAAAYRAEYETFPLEPGPDPRRYHIVNDRFERVDGELLWCMVRRFRPRRILEIGAGMSTLLSAEALLRNAAEDGGAPGELTAVDPYPTPVLRRGVPGLTRLLISDAQDLSLERFTELERNDILFIDSSHVLKTGSDVQYLFLEALPCLQPGVVVHVHDIFLPSEFPKDWIKREHRFWTEQYLLQAFLAFNSAFEVLIAASHLHHTNPEALEAAFPSYRRDRAWPASFWMHRIR